MNTTFTYDFPTHGKVEIRVGAPDAAGEIPDGLRGRIIVEANRWLNAAASAGPLVRGNGNGSPKTARVLDVAVFGPADDPERDEEVAVFVNLRAADPACAAVREFYEEALSAHWLRQDYLRSFFSAGLARRANVHLPDASVQKPPAFPDRFLDFLSSEVSWFTELTDWPEREVVEVAVIGDPWGRDFQPMVILPGITPGHVQFRVMRLLLGYPMEEDVAAEEDLFGRWLDRLGVKSDSRAEHFGKAAFIIDEALKFLRRGEEDCPTCREKEAAGQEEHVCPVTVSIWVATAWVEQLRGGDRKDQAHPVVGEMIGHLCNGYEHCPSCGGKGAECLTDVVIRTARAWERESAPSNDRLGSRTNFGVGEVTAEPTNWKRRLTDRPENLVELALRFLLRRKARET